jgi:hypothetical protein
VLHPFLHRIDHGARDADLAGLGERLDPLADGQRLPGQLAPIDQRRAVVNADPQLDALWGRHCRHAMCETFLNLDRAAHRGERAHELGERATFLEVEDAAAVDRNGGVDHLVVMQLQRRLGARAILRDQALVVGNVGHENRRELLFDADSHGARSLGEQRRPRQIWAYGALWRADRALGLQQRDYTICGTPFTIASPATVGQRARSSGSLARPRRSGSSPRSVDARSGDQPARGGLPAGVGVELWPDLLHRPVRR